MLKKILTLILLGFCIATPLQARKASKDTVYTFPFHLDSRLLVFEGKLNGIAANFVFDTGAGLGLVGQGYVDTDRVKVKGKRITMRDSNGNSKTVKTGISKEMQIGGLKIKNPRVLITEMPYLACQDYYLLGSNVIKQFNWQIDFDKMLISVSQKPFPIEPEYLAMEVFYENTRPFTQLSFGGMNLSKVLIDTGYSRILDIDNSATLTQDYISYQEEAGRTNANISLSTGALGEAMDETIQIKIDTLDIAGNEFYQVPTDFFETKLTKLGIGFFNTLSKKTIINNTQSTYYLDPREAYTFDDPMLLNLNYTDEKVLVGGKSLEKDSGYEQIEIGDEVLSINGIPTSNFENECQFSLWYFRDQPDQLTIETKDGKVLTFGKTSLK